MDSVLFLLFCSIAGCILCAALPFCLKIAIGSAFIAIGSAFMLITRLVNLLFYNSFVKNLANILNREGRIEEFYNSLIKKLTNIFNRIEKFYNSFIKNLANIFRGLFILIKRLIIIGVFLSIFIAFPIPTLLIIIIIILICK
jgi:hypothetical protein